MSEPSVIVCAGGGGVGKTTTSAALSLALAKQGNRVLIVSLDPARRLADALGVELGTEARELSMDAGSGTLFGLMPDPKDALHTFVEILSEGDLGAIERLRNNAVYRAMEAAVPGIHELASINLTWRAIEEHDIDTVVIDTAPSRNAVDFISYPRRLAQLLGSRAIGWMADLGTREGASSPRNRMRQVERLLVWAIGPVVSDVADFFTELARVRSRFLWLNEHVARLLLHPRTHYFLVAAPTTAARDDAQYLLKKLRSLKIDPRGFILNSAYVQESDWIDVLEDSDVDSDCIREVLASLREEHQVREQASARVARTFSNRHPSLTQLRLPYIEVPDPRDIVLALSNEFDLSHMVST